MFYLKIVATLCALSGLAAGSIYFYHHYPFELILTHLVLCLAAFSLCTAIAVIAGRKTSRPLLQSLAFSVTVTALIMVYAGNTMSNYFWKANLSFALVGRMLSHYFALYPVYTVLLVGGVATCLFALVAWLLWLFFRKRVTPVNQPSRLVFYCLSLSVFLMIGFNTLNHDRKARDLEAYFLGEMLIDLTLEYTDSHNDYLLDAGGIEDRVEQTVDYVVQTDARIAPEKKNIIMLVVDCMRADHLYSYGYHRNNMPFVNQLMQNNSSAQVDFSFAICDESKCGIRSILTSRGIEHQNSLEASENSLHQKLADDGYQINFLLTSDHSFGGLKRIYSPYDFYIDGIGFNGYPLNDDRGAVSMLENWPDYNGSPNYFHFHLFSAHEAGIRYGKYLDQAVHGIEPGFLRGKPIEPRYATDNPTKLQSLKDEMDNRLFQTDLVISRIYDLLDERGYLDNALIIITGDHGQGLNEHGYMGHIKGLHNVSLRVPLIMIDTSGDPLTLEEKTYATQRDIAPTLAQMLDLPSSETWEGQMLQTARSSVEMTTHRIPDRSGSYAKTRYDPVNNTQHKYILMSSLRGMKEERYFYDLLKDPFETNNLLEDPQQQQKYQTMAAEWQLDHL